MRDVVTQTCEARFAIVSLTRAILRLEAPTDDQRTLNGLPTDEIAQFCRSNGSNGYAEALFEQGVDRGSVNLMGY